MYSIASFFLSKCLRSRSAKSPQSTTKKSNQCNDIQCPWSWLCSAGKTTSPAWYGNGFHMFQFHQKKLGDDPGMVDDYCFTHFIVNKVMWYPIKCRLPRVCGGCSDWKKSCTSWYVVYIPLFIGLQHGITIQGGAGFRNHPQFSQIVHGNLLMMTSLNIT